MWASRKSLSIPSTNQRTMAATPANSASSDHLGQAAYRSVSTPQSEGETRSGPNINVHMVEEVHYQVPESCQATTCPLPEAIDPSDPNWLHLPYAEPPLEKDPSTIIRAWDIIKVFVATEEGSRTEYAKVLDGRRLQDGTFLLLVCWYYSRRVATTALVRFPGYLEDQWPHDAKFRLMLGCHYDVIDSSTVVGIARGDKLNRFCHDSIWGGEKLNYRIISIATLYDDEERDEDLDSELLEVLLTDSDRGSLDR